MGTVVPASSPLCQVDQILIAADEQRGTQHRGQTQVVIGGDQSFQQGHHILDFQTVQQGGAPAAQIRDTRIPQGPFIFRQVGAVTYQDHNVLEGGGTAVVAGAVGE